MAAAHTLAEANISFKVLEARNHTGGRTHTVKFGDPEVFQGFFEIGSNWICGYSNSNPAQTGGPNNDQNPVYTLAKKVGLGMHVSPGVLVSLHVLSSFVTRDVYTFLQATVRTASTTRRCTTPPVGMAIPMAR